MIGSAAHPTDLARSAPALRWIVLLALLLPACSGTAPVRRFHSIGDHVTSIPPSRAEGGQTPRIEAPVGFSWSHRVEAFVVGNEERGDSSARFELQLTVTDRTGLPDWRFQVVAEEALLVDDQGGRFPCTSARVPDAEALAAQESDRDGPPSRTWVLRFQLPDAYRPTAMSVLVVHWAYRIGTGPVERVTSRFRI